MAGTSVLPPQASIAPLEPAQQTAATDLFKAPIKPLQAPVPSSVGGLKPDTAEVSSFLERIRGRLGSTDSVVEKLARDSAFTADGLEVKNQQRVKAFVSGPALPQGYSAGEGANTLRPFVLAPANSDRLNAGDFVRREISAPVMRSIGNTWGDRVNASSWDSLARVMTSQANLDPAGFAQVNHTGNFIADRDTTQQLYRGENRNGAFLVGMGGVNAGAGFTKQDGAAGGAVAAATLQQQVTLAPSMNPILAPSGAGALAAPNAYGVNALIGFPM